MTSYAFSILLEGTSHPGNIGASARAMKTMGLSDLRLIQTVDHKQSDAWAMASGADDVVDHAKRYASVEQAAGDLQLLIGLSARKRQAISAISTLELTDFLNRHPNKHSIGFLFGNEQSGLDNDSLSLCHAHMFIPTNPNFSSLNLAASVQIVSYLCRMISTNHTAEQHQIEHPAASMGSVFALSDKLMRIHEITSTHKHSPIDNRALSKLILSYHPSARDCEILHGVLKNILHCIT